MTDRSRLNLSAFSVLMAITWLGGCTGTGSLRPLESDEPLTTVPDLSGKWVSDAKDDDKNAYFLVENTGGQTFRVTSVTEGEEFRDVYDLSLVQVGSYTFFDAAFKETGNKEKTRNVYELGVLPIHFIGRIWAEGDSLQLGVLDYDWMSQMESSGRLKVPHVQEDEGDDHIILLTAKSDELRDFLRQYAEEPAAFSAPATFHREPRTDKPAKN